MPKTRRLSDATLVRRSQQGDRRAFGALVARYDRRLRGLAHALLLDRRQMDAALGMAYLRAWRDVVRIKPRDEVGPWLYRAAYNACIDQLRRGEAPAGVTDGLRSGLAGLAPADRVAVVLVEREGFTVASAARILGVGVEVIETRLDVARDHLKPWTPEPAAPAPADPATVGAGAAEPSPAVGAGAGEPSPAPTVAEAAAAASAGGEGADAADLTGTPSGVTPDASASGAERPGRAVQPAPAAAGADGQGSEPAVPAGLDGSQPAPGDAPVPEGVGAATTGGNGTGEAPLAAAASDGAASDGRGDETPEAADEGSAPAAPDLPAGDAVIDSAPPDLSEEIIIAAEDAAAAAAAAGGNGHAVDTAGTDPDGPAEGAAAPTASNGHADTGDDESTVVLPLAPGPDRGRGRRARRRARFASQTRGPSPEGPGDDVSNAR